MLGGAGGCEDWRFCWVDANESAIADTKTPTLKKELTNLSYHEAVSGTVANPSLRS
jgi:hypothetical protein